MTNETDERRRQIIGIGLDRMVAVLRGDVVLTGLPEDAIITAVNYNFVRQSIDVIVEHQSFASVSPGHTIPDMTNWGLKRVERVVVVEGSAEPAELLRAMKDHSRKGALVIVDWRDEVQTTNE